MKRAIVIGATSGIGRALVKVLVENGFAVGATGRREKLLAELQAEHPGKVFISTLDVTDISSVKAKLSALVEEIGGLDLLILSSGTGHVNHDLDFAKEKEAIDTNVLPFALIAGWAFTFFEKQKAGHFAGITSIAGLRGGRHAPAYNATKAFQIRYLEGLRAKVKKARLPIVITDIRPGFVDTAMAKGDDVFWVAPVGKAAAQIYHAIENRKPVAYITRRWGLIAFVLRMLPKFVYERF
ncbi:MAG TPA: SDR family NAD(P)-dependent oxidoreductase [Candidatus Acidoferrales bacterium]|jgi:short-subunit dehydrogenase|nr:SDR family NAD(P)-dependent oxidoreductase [Candidatus Acidoferrales bacterium]